MNLETWQSGELAGKVKDIIDRNFKKVSAYSNSNIRAMYSQELSAVDPDYLRNKIVVFDIDESMFFQYDGTTGTWHPLSYKHFYKATFMSDSWNSGNISIPYETHNVTSPSVQVYIKNGAVYEAVIGGVRVDSEFNVWLLSDIPFEGMVVIQ